MDMLQHIHLNNMGVQKIGKQAHLKKNWGCWVLKVLDQQY